MQRPLRISEAGDTLYRYAVSTGWLVHKHAGPLIERIATARRHNGRAVGKPGDPLPSWEIREWGGFAELVAKAYVREFPARGHGQQWWRVFPPRTRGEAVAVLREHFEDEIARAVTVQSYVAGAIVSL